jgi:beta-glucosidase
MYADFYQSMPGDTTFLTGLSFWGTNLTIAVANGTVPEWRLDDACVRIMSAYYLVGRDTTQVPINFDSWTRNTFAPIHIAVESPIGLVNEHVDVRDDHASLIREIGRASTVLLKNTNQALPLTGKERNFAVFGEDAGPNRYGANGCPDRGCDNGTLAMGWGSGTADFPYLVIPAQAIQNYVLTQTKGVFEAVFDQGATTQVRNRASQADIAIVFVNADSGEGYISVDGNQGDRKNLTLWRQGDDLIKNVASLCNNTIVVMHTVGPVMVSEWYDNDNVTAILWAGLPGQESGNAIVDVLSGRYNPGGKLPFTLGPTPESYGTKILSEPNNGQFGAPQDDFSEGVFIDYRAFDRMDITPIYEFGFGLSYTTFSYSDLVVRSENAGPYIPSTGTTPAAPSFGSNPGMDYSQYLFPNNTINRVPKYIYPYLNSTDPATASGDPYYGLPTSDYVPEGATEGSPQPVLPAGGSPGGNPGLWTVLYTVTATITNTGSVQGDEVAQLYVSLGGDEPAVVLRGFDRLTIAPGASATFTAELTRRDLSTWDTVSQNWIPAPGPVTVHVGSSSRKLPLSNTLQSY